MQNKAIRMPFWATLLIFCLFFTACSSNGRPNPSDTKATLEGSSILLGATVTVTDKDSKKFSSLTDEKGAFKIENVSILGDVTIKICGGTFFSSAVAQNIATDLCLTKKAAIDGSATSYKGHVVDFLSTFVASYDSPTAQKDWLDYIGIDAVAFPTLEASLTDSSIMYLWTQGVFQVAKRISDANGIQPETSLSTQNLFSLLLDDLKDNNNIDGSTGQKFGGLSVNGNLLKDALAIVAPSVTDKFTTSDLKAWLDNIKNTKAVFLKASVPFNIQGPTITITSPNTDKIYGTTTVKTKAEGQSTIVWFKCFSGDTELSNTKTPPDFEAALDTTVVADGSITIKCRASDGFNISEKSTIAQIVNKNPVSFFSYVAEPMTNIPGIDVFDAYGKYVVTFAPDEKGAIKGTLPPGSYTCSVKSGKYVSKVLDQVKDPLNPLNLDYTKPMKSRFSVDAGAGTEIVITPITDLRENLFNALVSKSAADPVNTSLNLIEKHFAPLGFPLYVKPSTSDIHGNHPNQYYFALSAFEQLAKNIAIVQQVQIGSVTAEDIISNLDYDLQDALLDGTGGVQVIKGFKIDSFFFRYWYAIAVKNYVESLSQPFSDYQEIIWTTSMDSSVLFPALDKPRKVVNEPPTFADLAYKSPIDTDFVPYDSGAGKLPYAGTATFGIRFSVSPGQDQVLVLKTLRAISDSATCTTPTPVSSKLYEISCTFDQSKADGDKNIVLEVYDEAGNKGTNSLLARKLTVAPAVNITCPNTIPHKSTSTDLTMVSTITTAYPYKTAWHLNISTSEDYKSGDVITLYDKAALKKNSVNLVYVSAMDMAGNSSEKNCSFVVDDISPTADGSMTRINPTLNTANNTTDDDSLTIRIERQKLKDPDPGSPSDKITARYTLTDQYAPVDEGLIPIDPSDATFFKLRKTNLNKNRSYTLKIYFSDEAGNESDSYLYQWAVDYMPPPVVCTPPVTTPDPVFDVDCTLGTGDPGDPDKILFPSDEILSKVSWKDKTQGTSGDCTYNSGKQKFVCHVDAGSTPIPGGHQLYFRGTDALGNVISDDAKCVYGTNLHCMIWQTNFDVSAPVITGFSLDKQATKDALTINWDLLAYTTFVCSILDGSGTTVKDCSGSRGTPIDLSTELASKPDGSYTVKLVATRYSKSSDKSLSFILDRTAPQINNVSVTAQDETTFTIQYDVSDLTPDKYNSSLKGRKYVDNDGNLVTDSSNVILENMQAYTSSKFSRTYNKSLISGGKYSSIELYATDKMGFSNTRVINLMTVKNDSSIIKTTRETQIKARDTCIHKKTTNGKNYCNMEAVILFCDSCTGSSGISLDSLAVSVLDKSDSNTYDYTDWMMNKCNSTCPIYADVQNLTNRYALQDGFTAYWTHNLGITRSISRSSAALSTIFENYNGKYGLVLCSVTLNDFYYDAIYDPGTGAICNGMSSTIFYDYYQAGNQMCSITGFNDGVFNASTAAVYYNLAGETQPSAAFAPPNEGVFSLYATLSYKGYGFTYKLVP